MSRFADIYYIDCKNYGISANFRLIAPVFATTVAKFPGARRVLKKSIAVAMSAKGFYI